MVEHVQDFLTLYIGVKALKEGMTLETLEWAAPVFRKRRTQRRLQETTMSVYIHGGVASSPVVHTLANVNCTMPLNLYSKRNFQSI
jgi:hypothetical protein